MQGDSMKDSDVDKYLSQHLSGSPPQEAFKQQTLRDSTAALVQVRRRHSVRRRAECAVAAVLKAGIAFIGGRLSVPRTLPGNVDIAPRAAAEVETDSVNVPSELVAWLDAARFFKRLGMEERMARAFDKAGKLLPYDSAAAKDITEQGLTANSYNEVYDNQNNHSILAEILGPHESVESISGIMAQSFGGYHNEGKKD
ncbi:MAG: hypothetical protein RQ760_13875 [Sedimentisphaerales bacterium]|nr:hypothetical protein [Sedimentisphaerales bacterium]